MLDDSSALAEPVLGARDTLLFIKVLGLLVGSS